MLLEKPTDIVVLCADLHINDTVGLCPPEYKRANRDVHLPSVGQRFLWKAWLDVWATVKARKAQTGASVYTVWAGDIGDLNRHSNAELISTVKKNVQDAMTQAAQPALDVSDYNFVVRGTTAHVGELAELEEQFAADIGAERCTAVGSHTWPVLPLQVGGVSIEVSHRPPCSTRQPQARNLSVARAAGLQAIRAMKQRIPPRVHLRLGACPL